MFSFRDVFGYKFSVNLDSDSIYEVNKKKSEYMYVFLQKNDIETGLV